MRISIIGTGYVGLCTGVGFAMKGHDVICVDKIKEKIELIKKGEPPIYEPGLKEELGKAIGNGKLRATTDTGQAINSSDACFICVGTPSRKDGSVDLGYVKSAAEEIGKALKEASSYFVVVVKSTVTPETTERLVIPTLEKFSEKKAGKDFGVCMNPEFLREGTALKDFLEPDRVVIGELDRRSGDVLAGLYKDFDAPMMRTGLAVAETIKYANNAFLATKVSFSNEVGNICKRLGIDVYEVMKGVGMDKRISPHFFRAGVGWGGSCFPKDVDALVHSAKRLGYEPRLLHAVVETNKRQKIRIVEQLEKRLGKLGNKKIAVLGLSFKPDTDDIREAPSLDIIAALKRKGAAVSAYDPQAMKLAEQIHPDITYAKSAKEALKDSDGCIIVTEWDEFKKLTDEDFKSMRQKVVIEGRKALNPANVTGVEGICW